MHWVNDLESGGEVHILFLFLSTIEKFVQEKTWEKKDARTPKKGEKPTAGEWQLHTKHNPHQYWKSEISCDGCETDSYINRCE